MDGLLAALRLGLRVGDGRDAAACAGIADWPAVARLAIRHRVRPLLLSGLASAKAKAAGSGLEDRLRELRIGPQVRGLRQLSDLGLIADTFAADGIDFVVLKGLPLSQRLHGSPLLRESIDIDLLVAPNRFEDALKSLTGSGWRCVRPNFRETPRRKRWHDGIVKDRLFARAGGGTAIELHHRLLNNPSLFNPPFERLLADGRLQAVAGRRYPVLGDDHLLPYLACHGLEHYWHRLKWLCDIAALVAALDDERLGRLAERCGRQGLGAAFGSAFRLCADELRVGAKALEPSADGLRVRMVSRRARREWRSDYAQGPRWALNAATGWALRFVLKGDLRYVLFELARLLVAPWEFGRPDLPDRWLWLHPVLRPATWIARALRRRSLTHSSPS